MSKKNFSTEAMIHAARQRRLRTEKAFPRKKLEVALDASASPSWYMPSYEIILKNGESIGNIMRGHRRIISFKNKGVFGKALKQMEQIEAQTIKKEGFDDYRQNIFNMLIDERKMTSEISNFIYGINEPHYIDYTGRKDVLCALLKYGYDLSPNGRRTLEKAGLAKGANKRDVIKFVKNAQNWPLESIFILVKKV